MLLILTVIAMLRAGPGQSGGGGGGGQMFDCSMNSISWLSLHHVSQQGLAPSHHFNRLAQVSVVNNSKTKMNVHIQIF